MPARPALLPLEDYVAQVLSSLTPLAATTRPLAEAHGLVLAGDVRAAVPVPPWTNSAMDGYAVRARDVASASAVGPVSLPVSGDVPAGVAPGALPPGTAMRIMTGAMLPEGADAVVKVEDTDQRPGPGPLPGRVALRTAAQPGAHVRRAGEDVRAGDLVVPAGTVLSATAISAVASAGLGAVAVIPAPRVAVVSTGSELTAPGLPLPPGSIPDSNGLLLAGLVREHGALLASLACALDDAGALARTLTQAAEGADLVITSGGVSAGAFDPLTMLAADSQAGAGIPLSFAKLAMQPGKPQGHGMIQASGDRRVPLLMLPGNPVSVLVSFTTIVAPVLARLAGHDGVATRPPGAPGREPASLPLPVRARAATGWRTAGARRQYIPVRLTSPPTDLPPAVTTGPADLWVTHWVSPAHRLGSGSHLVASLPAAQALAVVEAGTPRILPGDEVTLIALSGPPGPVPGAIPHGPGGTAGAGAAHEPRHDG